MRWSLLIAASLSLLAVPASATGNSCGKGKSCPGTGNTVYGKADPITVNAPNFSDRGVYIKQIGDENTATVTQTAARARTDLLQQGNQNSATITQRGAGAKYAGVGQVGSSNSATASQTGAGAATLYVKQSGSSNTATAVQNASGMLYNGAVLVQKGHGNAIALTQEGEGNRALLTQEGSSNRMAAVQTGNNNRLAWTQEGNNLSHPTVLQQGGGNMAITQTGGR